MDRRSAIAALLMGAPMASTYSLIEPWKPDAKTYAVIGPDGRMEVLLDNLRCLRVTLGGESIDVSAAEIFEALRVPAHIHSWHPSPFFAAVAITFEEPTYYPPGGSMPLETCDCGALRLPGDYGKRRGQNLATEPKP